MANWNLAAPLKKVCPQCGGPFTTIRSNRIYCEDECKYQAVLARARTPEGRAADRRRERARRTWVVRQTARPIRLDVNLPTHLSDWVKGMTIRNACTSSEVLRSAVEYARSGARPRPRRVPATPRVRQCRTHLTVLQGLYVDDLVAKDGRTRSDVLRSLLVRLKAALDPPVGA